MSRTWVNFAGFVTDTMGVYPTGKNAHNAAERDVTTFQIPGRNGDLIVDNGRYKNIEITYPCFVMGLAANEQKIRDVYGVQRNGYDFLEDSYDTTHFRRARHIGEIEFEPFRGDAANFDLVFDCDPRRFLNIGEDEQTFTSNVWSDTNPTWYPAKPVVYLDTVGNGLKLDFYDDDSGRTITMTATTSFAGEAIIDCELQDVYDPNTGDNLNYLFTLSGDFPELGAGFNSVTITGTYSTASIKPRWWEL